MNGIDTIPYKKILVIQTGFVGDMVLTSPLFRSLRLHARGASITLLHSPRTAGVVRRCVRIDERIVMEKRGGRRGMAETFRTARMVREKRFDLVLSPHRSIRSGLVALGSGADRRIGFDRPPAALFYTDTVPFSRWESTFIRRKLRLLEPLGIFGEDETPEAYWNGDDEETAAALLGEAGVRPPFAVLAVGSAWPTKRWPADRFGELSRLLEKRGIASVLVGGESDREAGARAADGGAADMTGRTGFETLGALLSRAALFVGNDSGTLHLARAARCPAIALFGPTGPEQFRFGPTVRVVRSDEPCAPCSDHGSNECPLGDWVCLPRIDAARVAREAFDLIDAEGEGDRG